MSRYGKEEVFDGLVLRTSNHGDNDTLVEILTAERGRVFLLSRGARSPKSATRAAIQPFTYANFEIAKKDGPGWIRNATVIESFYSVRDDMLKLSLASYVSQIVCELSGEDEPAEDLLRLALNTLYLLAYRIPSGERDGLFPVKAAFELRAMMLSGYVPELYHCEHCGSEICGTGHLIVGNGTLVCEPCMRRAVGASPDPAGTARGFLTVSPSVLTAMRYVVEAPPKRIYAFTLPDPREGEAFSAIMEQYVQHHLEQAFDALKNFHAWGLL